MTLHDLSQLRALRREILLDTERLARLDVNLYPSARLMQLEEPEKAAACTAHIRKILAHKRLRCLEERERLEEYIASVDDSLVRLAMTLRFADGLSWRAVAVRIGGGNTEDSVKKLVYRYLARESRRKKGSETRRP